MQSCDEFLKHEYSCEFIIGASVSEPPLSVVTRDFVCTGTVRDAWSYIPQILQIPISTACPRSRSPHNALLSLVLNNFVWA